MANDPTNSFLLKILSGLQFGVEVALTEGTYSFGSGEGADIQFADVTLQPVHGRIRIRGGKLDLKSEGGDLSTSSGLTISASGSDWNEIAQLDIIEAGTTRFAVGGRGAKWSTLASASKASSSGNGTQGSSSSGRSGGFALGVLGVAIVALLSAGGFYFAGRDMRMIGATQTDTRTPVELVNSAINGLPFDHRISVHEAVDGAIDVRGYVRESVERRAVNNALQETGVQVTRRIWVRNAIEIEVADLIRSQNAALDFDLSETGVLTLTGTMLDPESASSVVSLVRDEVFGLSAVNDEVRTAEYYLAEAGALLEETRLDDRVILRLDGPLVEATGVVTTDRIDNWVGFVQAYANRYAEIIPLRSFVTLESQGDGAASAEPIVIGATVRAGRGRTIAPALLAAGGDAATLELFAQPQETLFTNVAPNQDAEATAQLGAQASDSQTGAATQEPEQLQTADAVLNSALLRLSNARPELFAELTAQAVAGEIPSIVRLQDAATVVGASFSLNDSGEGLQPVITLPGFDEPLTVEQVTQALNNFTASGPSGSTETQDNQRANAQPISAGAEAASLQIAPLIESLFSQPSNDVLPSPRATQGAQQAADQDSDAAPEGPANTTDVPSDVASGSGAGGAEPTGQSDEAQQENGRPTLPLDDERDGRAPLTAGFPSFATGANLGQSLSRLVNVSSQLADIDDAFALEQGGTLLLTPNDGGESMLQLAQIQRESLLRGETRLQMPRPLSARPVLMDRPLTCWPESRIRVEAMPSVLVMLDLLSLHADLDFSTFDADLQPILMEAALSPDRIEQCLEFIDSDYSRRLAGISAFLSESRRNSSFSQFLFRDVPAFDITMAGVNLADDRYMQAPDGSKLREGSAPDLSSRVSAIGDRGAMFRVEGGWEVWLYPESLTWLILDDVMTR